MNAMVISAATPGNTLGRRSRAAAPAWGGSLVNGTAVGGTAFGSTVSAGTALRGSARRKWGGLQLTRRGRLVFLGIPAIALAAVMVFVSLAVVLGSMAAPAHASAAYAAVDMAEYAVSVTVLQGESLWSIAAEADPNRDVRDVVSEIVALNELGSGVIQAGQRLYVPRPK